MTFCRDTQAKGFHGTNFQRLQNNSKIKIQIGPTRPVRSAVRRRCEACSRKPCITAASPFSRNRLNSLRKPRSLIPNCSAPCRCLRCPCSTSFSTFSRSRSFFAQAQTLLFFCQPSFAHFFKTGTFYFALSGTSHIAVTTPVMSVSVGAISDTSPGDVGPGPERRWRMKRPAIYAMLPESRAGRVVHNNQAPFCQGSDGMKAVRRHNCDQASLRDLRFSVDGHFKFTLKDLCCKPLHLDVPLAVLPPAPPVHSRVFSRFFR